MEKCSKFSNPICQTAFSLFVPMIHSLDLLIYWNSGPGLNHCEISITNGVYCRFWTYFLSFVYNTLEVRNTHAVRAKLLKTKIIWSPVIIHRVKMAIFHRNMEVKVLTTFVRSNYEMELIKIMCKIDHYRKIK